MSGINFLKPASSPFADENDTPVEIPEDAEKVIVNLDAKEGENAIILPDEAQEEGADEDAGDDDDLSKYSENVQKRIKEMSYNFHNSERGRTAAEQERDRALEHAKKLQAQLDQMSGQTHQTTTELAKQMQKSHEEQIATAQALLVKAHEEGNSADIAKYTSDVGRLNGELATIKSQAANYERSWKTQEAQRKAQQQPQPQAQPQGRPQAIAGEAQKWLTANPWFTDPNANPETVVKQQDALEFNNRLVKSGRFNVNDPALYKAVDDYLNKKYPAGEGQMNNGQSSSSGQPPVTGVATTPGKKNSGKKSRTMELTASEVEMAVKTLPNVPKQRAIELYAQAKQKLEG